MRRLTRRHCVIYACVSFVSFNLTLVLVTLIYTPSTSHNLTGTRVKQLIEPSDDIGDDEHEPPYLPEVLGNKVVTGRHNFRLPNTLITEYDSDVAGRVTSLAARKAGSRDPELVRLVLDVIDQPPTNKAGYKMFKIQKTPQVTEVQNVLNDLRDGFFVECGGLDGERLSNSAYLEREMNWQGLLVEMDPFFYTQLLGKNRHVWSINACLSPYDYFTTLPYAGDSRGRGQLVVDIQDKRRRTKNKDRLKVVPCFPFETILIALNRTRVDYFSLDVEGFELPILKSIDWHNVDIQVLSVEFNRGKDKTAYVEYMESQGFRTLKEVHNEAFYAHDYIFVNEHLYKSIDDTEQQPVAANRQRNRRKLNNLPAN